MNCHLQPKYSKSSVIDLSEIFKQMLEKYTFKRIKTKLQTPEQSTRNMTIHINCVLSDKST